MKKHISFAGVLALLSIMMLACDGNPKQLDETPTRGNIRISCDESFERITYAEIKTFQSLYPNAKITPVYKPESEVVEDFLNDSIRTIIIARKLTSSEEDVLKAGQFIARATKFAHDGVCLITNNENPDSTLRYDQLEAIFKGEIKDWSQLTPGSSLGEIVVVFDNPKSSNFRFIQDSIMRGGTPPPNCFAVKSNPEVIDYVMRKKNAIGVIGVNWVSDKDDTVSHKFLTNVRVLGIGLPGDVSGGMGYFKPYQGYIADGSYPLIRDVFVICRESTAGLGSGFASFVAGDVGQRIILKSGLVPATMPLRLVHVKKDF